MTRNELNEMLDEFNVPMDATIIVNLAAKADNISVETNAAGKVQSIIGWKGHTMAAAIDDEGFKQRVLNLEHHQGKDDD